MKNEVFKTVVNFIKRNDRSILTGSAMAGTIGLAISAYKIRPKVDSIREKCKKEGKTKGQTIVECTKVLLPTLCLGVFSEGCILASHQVSSKRIATFSALYSLTEEKLKRLDMKSERLENSVSKEERTEVLSSTDSASNVLCYDDFSGRKFKSTTDKIKLAFEKAKVKNSFNGIIYLNDFYNELGLSAIPAADGVGWRMYDDVPIDSYYLDMYGAIDEDTGEPCIRLDTGDLTWLF